MMNLEEFNDKFFNKVGLENLQITSHELDLTINTYN